MSPSTTDTPFPPLHGYRGDAPAARPLTHPRGLSVAISREAGARGVAVARKVGVLLGWQVFEQESLDYLIQNDTAREQLLAEVPPAARTWTDAHFKHLQAGQRLGPDPDTAAMVRLVLAVAARGDAVIVGRGAGFLLPAESTVHARVVAPFERRVAYFAQELRLTREEAAEEVRGRDARRAKFLAAAFGRNPADPTGYDLVVNADRLGVEGAAQLIGWAVRTKQMSAEIAATDDPAGS